MSRATTVRPFFTLPLAALLASLLAAGPAPAQDLQGAIRTQLAAADSVPVDQLFALGNRLLDAAPDNDDAFRNALLQAVDGASERTRLAAAVALKGLKEDDTFGRDLLALIAPLATSADEQVRGKALALLGDSQAFNSRVLPDVQKILVENCQDELVPPAARIEAALALWAVGSNSQRGIAKSTLELFLRSSDRDLEVRGALALAQINVESGKAWSVLRDIKDEPTDFGRQAQLFLQRAEMRREFDRDLANLAQRLQGAGNEPARGETDEYRMLDELRDR
ncbi:MAG: hypothetical protein KDE27_19495, partial [Planctomycetes bacterium]|nr:hypothetical protein [Planctomycetota bacterium]